MTINKKLELNDPNKLIEKLVCVRRHSRTVKGGRVMSFSALVVLGDGSGKLGFARGKGKEVPICMQKATAKAKRNMILIELNNNTIWHEAKYRYGSTIVSLFPAAQGTGIIAGSSMRAVLESAGIKDVLTKIHGSTNPANVVPATILALQSIRSLNFYANKRGIKSKELCVPKRKEYEQV